MDASTSQWLKLNDLSVLGWSGMQTKRKDFQYKDALLLSSRYLTLCLESNENFKHSLQYPYPWLRHQPESILLYGYFPP
jgi:hypothetical protein